VEGAKEKPLILVIDNNRDFTLSAKVGLERDRAISVCEENEPLVTKAEARSGLEIQGHPFLAEPISIPELAADIERNLPAHTASAR
jgi:hypothetical protein